MNHLFKLKKNGKTVWYSRFTPDWSWEYSFIADFKNVFHHYAVAQTKEITAHPFVCKDKNGKDVFAGDKNIKHDLYHDQLGKIVWCEERLRWEVFFPLTKHKAYIQLDKQLERAENIELIEENPGLLEEGKNE